MPVNPSALIDAARAMSVLDLLDRTSLQEGLAATLLTEQNHRHRLRQALRPVVSARTRRSHHHLRPARKVDGESTSRRPGR